MLLLLALQVSSVLLSPTDTDCVHACTHEHAHTLSHTHTCTHAHAIRTHTQYAGNRDNRRGGSGGGGGSVFPRPARDQITENLLFTKESFLKYVVP